MSWRRAQTAEEDAAWEALDPERKQVDLLIRIAEDMKNIRAIMNVFWWFLLAAFTVAVMGTAASLSTR